MAPAADPNQAHDFPADAPALYAPHQPHNDVLQAWVSFDIGSLHLSSAVAHVPFVILQAPPAPANLNGQHHPGGYREDVIQPIRGDEPGRVQDPHIDPAYQGAMDHHPQLMAVSNVRISATGPSFDQ
jgi:hypothetical protein